MEATFKQITKHITADQAEKCVNNYGSIVIVATSENGIEIKDMRKLADRLSKPVTNKGIVYYLGNTHFIVTAKKIEQLKKIANVVNIEDKK